MGTSKSRRNFIREIGAAALGLPAAAAAALTPNRAMAMPSLFGQKSSNKDGYLPVQVPGIPTLPYEMDGNTKVFRLTCEPVTIQFPDMSDPHGARRRPIHAWGYNGSVVGPTIEAVEGDHVRIIVQNNLPEPTSVHWHGLHVPIEMDGVSGISQEPIMPGEQFVYEYTLEQHGTYFYHPHHMAAKQVGMGMSGFFIVHPKTPLPWQIVDHDYAFFLQVWMIHPGSPMPDTLEMNNFNYFTLNGRAAPDIGHMKAKSGERVRVRLVNLSMLNHPIHLHGHSFRITEHGAGFLPENMHIVANTVHLSSAESRSIQFEAGRPGRWIMHCHFLHHVMNDMHRTPIPGGGMNHLAHEMGGMFTWIEVVP